MAAHKDMSNTMTDDAQVVRVARHVTWVGFWINALLGVAKVLAGVFGRSAAMVADGVHSFSDFVSDIIVIVFIGISRRKADERYQYGHGKYETFATMLLSLILAAVAVMFFVDGAEKTWGALHGAEIPSPTYLALGMCVVSIVSKEWLYRYTRRAGERIGSAVVVANAWHHRSDAVSSLGTLAGISGAMFLGDRWRILDPIAAILVSVFIIKSGYDIVKPCVTELLEGSLPESTEKEILDTVLSVEGIYNIHNLRTRRIGNGIAIDMHTLMDGDITLNEAHSLATKAEQMLRSRFGENTYISIHMEPAKNTPLPPP